MNVAMLLYMNCNDHPLTHRMIRITISDLQTRHIGIATRLHGLRMSNNKATTERTMRDSIKTNKHTHRYPPCLTSLFHFNIFHLQLEFALRERYLSRCRVVHEPYKLAMSHRPHTRSGQTELRSV